MAGRALVGHTGFVGGALAAQMPFDAFYNAANVEELAGRHFDLIVCAGVSAVKWLANREPERDADGIARLRGPLSRTIADHFVLISTIDVYADPAGRDESDAADTANPQAYGRHRAQLEAFVAERFASHGIVRLPALFGTGLKKNALFDLMHRNFTEKIVPNAAFQWYPLRRLASDLALMRNHGLDLLNLTAEPVQMAEIHQRFFPDRVIGEPVERPPFYDLRTRHAALFGGAGGYVLDRAAVLDEMAAFVAASA